MSLLATQRTNIHYVGVCSMQCQLEISAEFSGNFNPILEISKQRMTPGLRDSNCVVLLVSSEVTTEGGF